MMALAPVSPKPRSLRALLGDALPPAEVARVPERLEVSDLTLDSRRVRRGGAFLACQGSVQHGLAHAGAAVAAGARAILWEPAAGVEAPAPAPDVLFIAVPRLRAQASHIADRFFDLPSATVSVTGITGTNGKTTCAWLLAEAQNLLGGRAAYRGTLGTRFDGQLTAGSHTTPDAISLQRELAGLRAAGATHVALEVSSHALDQDRCAGVRFRAAAFTNLSRDHLDYHGDMQRYGAAKARLFEWPTLRARVINVDDAVGRRLAEGSAAPESLVLTSRRGALPAIAGARVLQAKQWNVGTTGLGIEIAGSWGDATLASPLIGDFNVDNLLTTLAVLLASDVPLAAACAALARCAPPPGRMQASGGDGQALVLVDYAHTPDALERALATARGCTRGRLVCVTGCGGERDRGKRPLMGRAAEQLADKLIVTDDNPRGEDPGQIVADILTGLRNPSAARVIHDRASAIAAALGEAHAGDVVLVAGKGHEDYQQVGAEKRPFSDLAVVRGLLASGAGR